MAVVRRAGAAVVVVVVGIGSVGGRKAVSSGSNSGRFPRLDDAPAACAMRTFRSLFENQLNNCRKAFIYVDFCVNKNEVLFILKKQTKNTLAIEKQSKHEKMNFCHAKRCQTIIQRNLNILSEMFQKSSIERFQNFQ